MDLVLFTDIAGSVRHVILAIKIWFILSFNVFTSSIDRVDIEGIAHLPSFNVTLIIISICFLFWLSFEWVCLSKLSTHGLDFALASQEDENASWR